MEEKREIQTPQTIFIEICRQLDVTVRFEADPDDGQKASPVIDVAAMLSKMIALMVYNGWNVPAHCNPSYTRVHADVEYWKRQFEQQVAAETPKTEEAPSAPPAG